VSAQATAITLRFQAHGMAGQVHIAYGVNRDPSEIGFELLGVGPHSSAALGFPVIEATVEYDGAGYHRDMGWVQVVRWSHHDGPLEVLVDRAPQMEDGRHPYSAWGPCPTLVDAPMNTRKLVAWRADAFLTISPDLLMIKVVQPVCSLQWGYDIDERGAVHPRPVHEQGLDVWDEVLPILQADCPDWQFNSLTN
jgi:hypothetical protein